MTRGQTRTQTHTWEENVSNCLGLHVIVPLAQNGAPPGAGMRLLVRDGSRSKLSPQDPVSDLSNEGRIPDPSFFTVLAGPFNRANICREQGDSTGWGM